MKFMGKKDQSVLERVLMFKLGYDEVTVAAVADDLLRDDFPKNGITTIGEAIAYIDVLRTEAHSKAGTAPAIE